MVSNEYTLTFGPLALLDETSRARLREHTNKRRLAAGETLIYESSEGDDVYLLIDGTLRVSATGEVRMLAMLSAPALVGELAVITRQARSATVIADTPCTVLVLAGTEMRRLMDEQPMFATAMRERADLLRADAFLKRSSPLRDLPMDIVNALAAQLRPRVLANDQLIEGSEDDLYLVRRGAIERLRDKQRFDTGWFVQREKDERYAAIDETWIYELRLSDVAREIIRYQERLRQITGQLGDRARVSMRPGCTFVPDRELGGVLVHDHRNRAVLADPIASLARTLDGTHHVAGLIASSGLARGPVVEGLAVLVAADLATIS